MSHRLQTPHLAENDPDTVYESLPTPSKPRNRFWSIITDTWIWESLMILLSLACFIGIVCILFVFNGKSQPSFAYGFTLNAIISILATACKASLAYVVAECIGQLKWIWYYREGETSSKQLGAIQSFDSASRGPLGSITILLQHKGLSLVSLGALATVLALMLDPFMQQLVTYPIREIDSVDGRGAMVKQAVTLLPESLEDPQTTIYTGMWAEDFEVSPTCPSGNCTWPAFQSVGMCSQCEDITSSTTFDCDQTEVNTTIHETHTSYCRFNPPDGEHYTATVEVTVQPNLSTFLRVNYPDKVVWTASQMISATSNRTYVRVKNPLITVAFAELVLADTTIAGRDPILDLTKTFEIKTATQCILSLCAREYKVSVSNGELSINTSAPDYGSTFDNPVSTNSFSLDRICWKPGTGPAVDLYNSSSSPDVFTNTSEFAFCPIDQYRLPDYFNEATDQYNASTNFTEWGPSDFRTTMGPLDTSTVPKSPIIDRIHSVGLEAVMRNIAASFTKAGLQASDTSVRGTVRRSEVYVSVRWFWLIFPAVLMVLGITFLALTVLVNSRLELRLWKSSILAVLFHGLDTETLESAAGNTDTRDRYATVSQMEKIAETTQVRLSAGDLTRGLTLNRC
ncbi:hypothetical protein BJX99DRAFT_176590 [Aspergillus californicus]